MNYQIELRHLIYFQTLAEELHFRKAAERLFISQPGLTRQIKQLEDIYQVKLFDRGKRFVRLTEAGQYMKAEVSAILQQVRQMEEQLIKIGEGKQASLRIGFIGSAVQGVLPDILLKIKQLFPLMDITLQELSNEIQLDLLSKNELEFGFIRINSNPTNLQLKPLLTEHFSLVVPNNYPIQSDNFTSLEAFKNESFILFSKEYSSTYYDLVMSIFKDHSFAPNVALRSVNALSIFSLVAQGLGVAIVPTSLKKGYEIAVKFIELDTIPQRTTLSLAWNETNRNVGIPLFLEALE
ncbi:LysR family transcriptional regulator [Sphingobacterium alkalisoli]|uniref:LysR family transcriptional regulator n=1 Tax=Sphingobacterium alkalisoli TaxID=1874115 RepID=A0A4U0GPB9_9SPHI|nr:LysR family transcriptional regulator [Sphingobacterium alkalisoli]TJY60741.1 LysR family transcriptional regulator [Sphingobacterium alkalisoli]GGH31660.1 LysR family transcriptional regulator [Sphingobacterium alkalisoli]